MICAWHWAFDELYNELVLNVATRCKKLSKVLVVLRGLLGIDEWTIALLEMTRALLFISINNIDAGLFSEEKKISQVMFRNSRTRGSNPQP